MKRFLNLWLVGGVIALAVLPLWVVDRPAAGPDGAEVEIFTGADGQAMEFIAKIAPSYTPWAKPLFTPPSQEVESLLFALQAALGAGFIGYYLGVSSGRSKARREQGGEAAC